MSNPLLPLPLPPAPPTDHQGTPPRTPPLSHPSLTAPRINKRKFTEACRHCIHDDDILQLPNSCFESSPNASFDNSPHLSPINSPDHSLRILPSALPHPPIVASDLVQPSPSLHASEVGAVSLSDVAEKCEKVCKASRGAGGKKIVVVGGAGDGGGINGRAEGKGKRPIACKFSTAPAA